MDLPLSLVQNDPQDIQLLEGTKCDDVEMVIGIVVGVGEIGAVDDGDGVCPWPARFLDAAGWRIRSRPQQRLHGCHEDPE